MRMGANIRKRGNMPKLNPCPFCGNTEPIEDDVIRSVVCLTCGGQLQSGLKLEDAIQRWNIRQQSESPPASAVFQDGNPEAARAAAGYDPKSGYNIYDKHGIPIQPGDTVKIFHYVAAIRREKRFMYKLAMLVEKPRDKISLMKFNHLDLTNGYYWEIMDGKVLPTYEIVQGYGGVPKGCDFRDRIRKKLEAMVTIRGNAAMGKTVIQ